MTVFKDPYRPRRSHLIHAAALVPGGYILTACGSWWHHDDDTGEWYHDEPAPITCKKCQRETAQA
ncbi:hypothetical protein [Marinitenerispora sediminis]|uniref:Uncharacterized protein n=1 Tax=Marinitenerispora sediminis TaxID=1931232 RepID=A0A368T721_9ACTN|nr:hypothetical protein [Marinitenerispora sediminis]RCV53487.1 hypothetical protein DEF23_17565 [Marinitenerispora sediminis]RCV59315.1 hypothetical protein DEF24_10105 [Marinitenerispora sediminis]